jgi:hypothetical protein
LAKDWNIPTIIERCVSAGFEAIELRTTHAHGVEPGLNETQTNRVREQFAHSSVRLLSLGTTCEYHSADSEEVKKNIEGTKEFIKLAAAVGALGVKVRPNGFCEEKGIPKTQTIKQIGKALKECGQFAENYQIEIWLEVHGRDTSEPPVIRAIMEEVNHPSVGICWNSNSTDVKNGSVKESFTLLNRWIRSVHINHLWDLSYPWRELFGLLKDSGYQRYTLAEIGSEYPGFTLAEISTNPIPFMHYYKALWEFLLSA